MMNDKEAIKDIYDRYEKNQNTKDKFFHKKIRLHNPNVKYTAIILFIVLLSSSISIGNNFFSYKSKNNIKYVDKDVYTNIDCNDMQNITTDYQKSNDVGVKVSNVLIKDSKLYLVFDFNFYEPLTDDVNLLKLPDMLISDESNNILYCINYEKYKSFCTENNLEFYDGAYKDTQILTEYYSSRFIEKDQNHIKYLFIINLKESYTNTSSNLKISFETIDLYINLLLYDENEKITKTGNWNLELNLQN